MEKVLLVMKIDYSLKRDYYRQNIFVKTIQQTILTLLKEIDILKPDLMKKSIFFENGVLSLNALLLMSI